MSNLKKSNKQSDQPGYQEGKRTGFKTGYKAGINDSLKVITSILEHNGIHLEESEFFIELDNLIAEGEISTVEEYN